ncbi:Dipeptidyl peptidase 2 [Desmophyllum pertusum]|uniref:Dipeptidyl peptidase 2 n=1 Tax=Desmophyllum pertusum TaxID=174260 RepID=A0A9X0CZU5_9CNID|nr:Dipeptidyl peptidase 2 [Desmophyllum pertusum]
MAACTLNFVLIASAFFSFTGAIIPYKTAYFEQNLDHFNFVQVETFKQRYIYTDQYWNGNGPIFFYTGNEGPIPGFWDNSGFVFEAAEKFNALVIFGEHRYYGESMPFGSSSFDHDKVGYLTVEQALADFAVLVTGLKIQFKATQSKVVAFGGSYGGMLSAYMRFKYPNVIDVALAASAPIYMVTFKGIEREFFFSAVTEIPHLLGWIRNSFTSLAMGDYPYPTTFLAPLPGYPVNVACKMMATASSKLQGLADVTAMVYNGTNGTLTCLDPDTEYIECADPTGCGLGPDSRAWDYQACTEVALPAGSNNKTDMFPVLPWTLDMITKYCQEKWGVAQRPGWAATQLWGKDIASASNIIFSNGDLDPWRPGGVLEDVSPTLVTVLVKGGAHHLDLRASNPLDPATVTQARKQELELIQKFIQ